jgi:hypothetical protein
VPKDISKYVVGTIAGVFVFLLFVNSAFDNYYVYNIRIPDPYLGKIVPYHVKNIVVYITKEQWNFAYWLRVFEFATGSIALSSALVEQINKS